MTNSLNGLHQPVLLEKTLELLDPKKGESYLDCTAGYGGHAKEIDKLIGPSGKMLLSDRDSNSIAELKKIDFRSQATIIKNDFASTIEESVKNNTQFDLVLLDLGVSSPQLDIADRGFSFMKEAQLDMRMDQEQQVTAAELVNTKSEVQLARMIRDYGEDPYAKRIASLIVKNRPYETTTQLAADIKETIRKPMRIHPATRTFQALRMEVNDELGQLKTALKLLPQILTTNGRVAVISFHSLEDRLVKQFFKAYSKDAYEAVLDLLTKKPIKGLDEDVLNPRARSSMLRAAVKK